MDVVVKTQGFLSNWAKSGEADCRKYLIQLHSTPADSNAADALVTVYHTLLSATLSLWRPKHPLPLAAFTAFVKNLFHSLPSSSQDAPSPAATALGELLIDTLWSMDALLDEIITDLKTNIATQSERGNEKDQDAATKDKGTLLEAVKTLLIEGVINPGLCRERLDMSLVAGLGLILDKPTIDRKEVRARTGLFYKQNKFNLIREQSEGYSKLVTEVISALPLPHSPATGFPLEPSSVFPERVQPIWNRIVSLIGYFDLDPNRALDVIVDLFSAYLMTNWSFFLVLFSLSPWKGQCESLTWIHEDKGEPMKEETSSSKFKGKGLDEILHMAESTGLSNTPPPQSAPRVMTQVLGFKFRHYQSADVTETTPRQLYLAAALLIRQDFITVDDLYPHLSPTDDELETKGYKAYIASIDARIENARISQLALAAPLESSTQTNSSTRVAPPPPEAKKSSPPSPTTEPKEPPNQKVGLLVALLSVGALRPALALLTKFPWLVDAYPEIADLLIRVMKHSLAALYDQHLVTKPRNPSNVQPRARWSATGVVPAPARKPMLTMYAPTPPGTSTADFVYFFPFWAERVPICTTLDDLIDVIDPLMAFVGLHVSRDPLFLTKFARLGRLHMASTLETDPATKKPVGMPDFDHPISKFWHKVLRVYFLPALPLIRGNAVCTVEIWNVIRQFETTVRWKLYGEWKTRTYTTHPELRVRAVQVDRESKGVLRRLSHNTIDTLSGTVAKIAHSNPCIFFTNAVNQIMAYDNLASVVVQALRYATNMGFDVLVYIILDALANPHKERVKDDGVNTSDWLQSLASFTGMLFRRYSADLTPLLKYIVHQLYAGQTTEIVVLRELIWKMAGIEPLPSLSETQIAAMAGGPTLRIEAVASSARGARLDPGDAVLKGPQRLGKALLESQLALPLLVQVAQQRQSAVYKIPDAHLKSLASLYDATHGVLLQYLELLTSPAVIQSQDYAQKVVPTLAELAEKYGICPPICMQIIRPILQSSLLANAMAAEEQERIANEEAEKRLKAALAAKRDPSIAHSRIASPAVGDTGSSEAPTTVEPKPSTQEVKQSEDVVMENGDSQNPWVPEIRALFDDVKKVAPKAAYDIIGPGFYLTFWQLSTYDLAPPAARYEEEGAALRTLSRQEDSKYTMADRSSDRMKRQSAQAHRAKRDRYAQFAQTLAQELKTQAASRRFTIKRLSKEKAHWFSHGPKAAALASAIIEHCIQPRCLLSPMDADYCAQVIKAIHIMGTPGFSTLMVYDRLLGDHIKVVVFSCSEYEAKNYGRFLLGILTDLYKWFSDEALYEQDNRSKVGGKVHYLPGFQQSLSPKFPVEKTSLLAWHNFQQVLRKWHRKLFKSLADSIKTNEFMHVYNAIIVLKEILPVFPLSAVIDLTGPPLNQVIETFIEKEERGDLKILARAYHASLKKREHLWAAANGSSKVRTCGTLGMRCKGAAPSPRPSTPVSAQPLGDKKKAAESASTPPERSTPSASRGHTQPPNGAEKLSVPSLAKAPVESAPRPEVVRRVRIEPRGDTPGRSIANGNGDDSKSQPMEVDSPAVTSSKQDDVTDGRHLSPVLGHRADASVSTFHKTALLQTREGPPTPLPNSVLLNLPPTKQPPHSPRGHRVAEERPSRSDAAPMPPPSAPSQTASAQELRETARQSIRRNDEQADARPMATDARGESLTNPPSLRRRSQSPPTRPGTRDASAESRTSGERLGGRGEVDRVDDRRVEHAYPSERREHRRERSERERERERGRDRHGDRDRDREHRERERDPERDRDKRDQSRKERERNQSTRPGHRSAAPVEETLGKRRRPADDDPDRASKRSSREKAREDRSRRSSDKEKDYERTRESDRRRRDREEDVSDPRQAPLEKSSEKRVSDGPPLPVPSPLPPTTPSAPRAMASGEPARNGKPDAGIREWHQQHQHQHQYQQQQQQHHRDRDRDRERERDLPPPPNTPAVHSHSHPHPSSSRDNLPPAGPSAAFNHAPPPPQPLALGPPAHGLAKKLLPIDPGANDKPRATRKDYD
ncbi:transcription factor/nuclear export subunit protein 2-domain-containing protein [Russula earlei]|uniref:Transcription factor/nuclear export subunit protein 2-domain-containing protein n=1 Tax=Russula earlei TaxID=71964 RepID=A0ACC0UM62_9AGAM|nr:transcription factor/nuclear export subunit protein 2-domain-containing protein [Russula earlei]